MGRAGRIVSAVVGAIALTLVLTQLFLPGIAASRITSKLKRYGEVQSVNVSAWPAVKLLWGEADSVSVRAADLRLSPAQSAKLLWEGRGASKLDLAVARVSEGPLRLSRVSVSKRGDSASAHATASEADVRAALPPGVSLKLLGSQGGEVRVRASGGLFGIGASVDAVAGPSQGRLVAHPVGFPLEGVRLTLFADPHVYVEGVAASAASAPDGTPAYRLAMNARLR